MGDVIHIGFDDLNRDMRIAALAKVGINTPKGRKFSQALQRFRDENKVAFQKEIEPLRILLESAVFKYAAIESGKLAELLDMYEDNETD